MNWLKNIILFLCCILTTTSSAMALDDDFDSGIAGWSITGSWTNPTDTHFGVSSPYLKATNSGASTYTAYRSMTGVINEFSFQFRSSSTDTTTYTLYGFECSTSDISSCNMSFRYNGKNGNFEEIGLMTYSSFTLTNGVWYSIHGYTSGNAMIVTVTNEAGTVLNSQVGAYTHSSNGLYTVIASYDQWGNSMVSSIDTFSASTISSMDDTYIEVVNEEYAVNDLVPITYLVSEDEYHWYSVYNIILINAVTGTQMYEFENIPQTGTYYFQATSGGKIIVELQQQTLLLYDTLASDTVTIGEYQSYIFTKNNIPSGILQNVTYIWGFTPTQNSYKYIKLNWFNPAKNSWEYVYTTSVSGNAVNTQYTTQILYPKIGKYLVELWDLNHAGVAASIPIEAYQGGQFPEHNYSMSNISILYLSPTYAAGDWLQYSYMVDGANYSSNRISIEFYNWNNSGYKGIEWVQSDSGIGKTYLLNDMMSGNIGVCLVATNATEVRTRLSCQNISISYMDSDGYALYSDKEVSCIGENILVTAISPTNSFLNVTGAKSYSYNFTGIKSFNYKITSADTYFTLDTLGQNKKNMHINAKACVVQDTDINTVEPATNLISENLIRFMSMPIFWGLVILILILIAASKWSTGLILPVMFITVNIEAIMGLFDPYKTFVLVITWLGFAVIFLVVQRRGGA